MPGRDSISFSSIALSCVGLIWIDCDTVSISIPRARRAARSVALTEEISEGAASGADFGFLRSAIFIPKFICSGRDSLGDRAQMTAGVPLRNARGISEAAQDTAEAGAYQELVS